MSERARGRVYLRAPLEFFLGRSRYGNKTVEKTTRARAQLPTIDISLKIIPRYIIYLFAFSYRFFLPIGIREETDFVPANSTFLSLRPRNVRGCEDEVGVEWALIKLWCHHISRHCWVTGLGTRPSLWFYKYLRTFTTWDEQDRVKQRKLQKSVRSDRVREREKVWEKIKKNKRGRERDRKNEEKRRLTYHLS